MLPLANVLALEASLGNLEGDLNESSNGFD